MTAEGVITQGFWRTEQGQGSCTFSWGEEDEGSAGNGDEPTPCWRISARVRINWEAKRRS